MSFSALYAMPDAEPTDGDGIASTTGWFHWTNSVLARAADHPELAHLAAHGWADKWDDLAHETEQLLHAPDPDPDLSAITAHVLAAVKGRPAEAAALLVTDGEPDDSEENPKEEIEGPAEGDEWVSEEGYALLSEAARVGLTLKTVTDKNGRQVRRWVRTDTATAAHRYPAKGAGEGEHRLIHALNNPQAVSREELAALVGHTRQLPKERLRQLALAFRQKIGGNKAELSDRLLELVRKENASGRSGTDGSPDAAASGRVAPAPGRTDVKSPVGSGDAGVKPAGDATTQNVPTTVAEAHRRIERYQKLFRSKGRHEIADWLGALHAHVSSVGDEGLASLVAGLGPEKSADKGGTQYELQNSPIAHAGAEFIKGYLDRFGVTAGFTADLDPRKPLVAASPIGVDPDERDDTLRARAKKVRRGDFLPANPTPTDKLEQSKLLPGLETSADLDEITGSRVTHLTPEVTAALDAKYGAGAWIVKPYTDRAYAGHGILFPQRAEKLAADSRGEIWSAGEEVGKHGFELAREKPVGGFPTALKAIGNLTLPESADEGQRWKHPDAVQKKHNDAVLAAAKEHGLLLDPARLSRIEGAHNVGGLEHDVHEDRESGRYFKFTKGGHFGQTRDASEYLAGRAVAEKLWPESGYKFEGVITDSEGRPQIVTSMNKVEGDTPTQDEIHAWFGRNGFEPHGGRTVAADDNTRDLGQWDWVHPATGTVVGDANPGNFRKRPDGTIVPIDVDIRPGKAAVGAITKEDGPERIVGLKHAGGAEYRFGSDKYNSTIHGDVRHFADRAAGAADHERGAALPGDGKGFMAQPAFPVVGVSEEARASGKTWEGNKEGRVHVVTKNGKAEVVPYATWVKGEALPVVFHDDDTRAMEAAAVDAFNKLPASERKGQVYAPDVVRTKDGYRVVEMNAMQNTKTYDPDTGTWSGTDVVSGYLHDAPMVIDSFVSHVTGREPGHVAFIRRLLSKERGKK